MIRHAAVGVARCAARSPGCAGACTIYNAIRASDGSARIYGSWRILPSGARERERKRKREEKKKKKEKGEEEKFEVEKKEEEKRRRGKSRSEVDARVIFSWNELYASRGSNTLFIARLFIISASYSAAEPATKLAGFRRRASSVCSCVSIVIGFISIVRSEVTHSCREPTTATLSRANLQMMV